MLVRMEELNAKEKETYRQKAKGIMTFRYLDGPELDRLVATASLLRYGAEEPVTAEGDLDPFFFGILEGTVSVTVRENEGRDVYICSLGPGDVFGEAGIFLNVKRTATVTALGDCVLLRLHRKDLSSFIKDQPQAGNKMLLVVIYGLLRKLRAANQELAFERKADMDQGDIDALIADMTGN